MVSWKLRVLCACCLWVLLPAWAPARGQGLVDMVAHVIKENLLIDTAVREEPVVGAPVQVLPAAGAEEVGDGGTFRAEQGGQQMLLQTLGTLRSGSGLGGDLQQSLELVLQAEGRGFFLRSTAGGGTA